MDQSVLYIFANFPEAELRPSPGGRGEVRGGDGCCVESVERLVVMFSCESGFSEATPSPHLTTNQITLRRPAHNRLGKCHLLTIFSAGTTTNVECPDCFYNLLTFNLAMRSRPHPLWD